jgi:hypothetical protein
VALYISTGTRPGTTVPEILPPNLVQPRFSVGKGINFIRHCLLDPGWTIDLGDQDEKPQALGYRYASDIKLTQTKRLAEQQVNHHIVASLREKHHLPQHLRGLKTVSALWTRKLCLSHDEGLHAKLDRKGIVGLDNYDVMGSLKEPSNAPMPLTYHPMLLGVLGVGLILSEDEDVRYQVAPAKGLKTSKPEQGGTFSHQTIERQNLRPPFFMNERCTNTNLSFPCLGGSNESSSCSN